MLAIIEDDLKKGGLSLSRATDIDRILHSMTIEYFPCLQNDTVKRIQLVKLIRMKKKGIIIVVCFCCLIII